MFKVVLSIALVLYSAALIYYFGRLSTCTILSHQKVQDVWLWGLWGRILKQCIHLLPLLRCVTHFLTLTSLHIMHLANLLYIMPLLLLRVGIHALPLLLLRVGVHALTLLLPRALPPLRIGCIHPPWPLCAAIVPLLRPSSPLRAAIVPLL